MAYVPKLRHLFKIMFGIRDSQAAEGLFLEGSIEFESGDIESARLMFTYGTRLDPNLAGNFYNLGAVAEKCNAPAAERIAVWERYLAAAARDPRQPEETRERVRQRIQELKEGAVT
ncbi:MAG: hypothetical protein PWP23_676 [Candidatus Sumerlaeota bacterium]|nr:hypothetical protein [Candidatus Sumerlaeota bacterium]